MYTPHLFLPFPLKIFFNWNSYSSPSIKSQAKSLTFSQLLVIENLNVTLCCTFII